MLLPRMQRQVAGGDCASAASARGMNHHTSWRWQVLGVATDGTEFPRDQSLRRGQRSCRVLGMEQGYS